MRPEIVSKQSMSSAGKLDLDPTAYRYSPDKVATSRKEACQIYRFVIFLFDSSRIQIFGRLVKFMNRIGDLRIIFGAKNRCRS